MKRPEHPNIIWVLSDQHRAQALGGMGDPNVRTPVFDRMIGAARTGISGSPLCSPYRGALLTGLYPHRCIAAHDDPLPPGTPTIADAVRLAGYRTAYFGKWHVDGADHRSAHTPPSAQIVARERRGGFDAWIGYENNNAQYDCWVHGHDETGMEIERYKLPGYETDALTDLLLGYLQRRTNADPFFAVVAVQPPHNPYVVPPDYTARHELDSIQLRPNVPPLPAVEQQARTDLAGYYAMIENLDWNTGRIFRQLEELGLADDTIVIYFSDHGDMHGSHGRIWKCVPWEESIRVPFLVADGHGQALPQIRADRPDLVNHVDILPTTLGLCGLNAPSGLLGTDYSGYFRADRPVPAVDSAYLQIVDPGHKRGYAADRERAWRGVVTRDGWKYAVLEGQPWLLFNLNDDPFELNNLALDGRYHAERQHLQTLLAQWIRRTGDQFPLPNIAWRPMS